MVWSKFVYLFVFVEILFDNDGFTNVTFKIFVVHMSQLKKKKIKCHAKQAEKQYSGGSNLEHSKNRHIQNPNILMFGLKFGFRTVRTIRNPNYG